MNFFEDYLETKYCYYCKYEHPHFIKQYGRGIETMVSDKTYEELYPTLTEFEKKWFGKNIDQIDPKKRVCKTCFRNKDESDLYVEKTPNYYKMIMNAENSKTEDYKLDDNSFNDSQIDSFKDQNNLPEESTLEHYYKTGWIGPVDRPCIDKNCNSTTCVIKIRPPISDDEPPIVSYVCTKCFKKNTDYRN